MNNRKQWTALAVTWLMAILCLQAQDINIDLAKVKDNKSYSVTAGQNFKITLENLIPRLEDTDEKYTILLEKRYRIPEPLSTTAVTAPPRAFAPPLPPCDQVESLYEALISATSESEVKDRKETLRQYLDTLTQDQCAILRRQAEEAIAATRAILLDNVISPGEYLQLTISRQKADGKTVSWVFSFEAGEKGKWITSYGFSFVTQFISNEGAYFLDQQADEFIITEKEDRTSLNFLPSIMFSYLWNNDKSLKFSPTMGLGVDTNKPTAFLGLSAFYNYNLGLTLGFVAHPQQQLAGQYKPGDVLTELIETNQLHQDNYKINFFFSFSYRFGQNPFEQKAD